MKHTFQPFKHLPESRLINYNTPGRSNHQTVNVLYWHPIVILGWRKKNCQPAILTKFPESKQPELRQ